MLLDTKKYPVKFYVVSGIGSGMIIGVGYLITYFLWKNGLGDNITPSNFQSSILLTNGISSIGGVTPLALMSLNALACKMFVKKFRAYVKKKLKI